MATRHHPETDQRYLDLLKCKLLPSARKCSVHARRPINARTEAVQTSGIFEAAFGKRWCIVPATAFYK